MYSILRIQYVHYTPDSVVQYTPKYSTRYPYESRLSTGDNKKSPDL